MTNCDLAFIQFGDYGQAVQSLDAGEEETYRDQTHSVEFVKSLSETLNISVLAFCGRTHHEQITERLDSWGFTEDYRLACRQATELLSRLNPRMLVCCSPILPVLKWCVQTQVDTLPLFADYFSRKTIREKLYCSRLKRLLLKTRAPCFSNHSLSASLSLTQIGIAPSLVVPWEFRRIACTEDNKDFGGSGCIRLLYIGQLCEAKGLGDLLDAFVALRQRNRNVQLTIAGQGPLVQRIQSIQESGHASCLNYLGLVSNSIVLSEMVKADVVVVPSRDSYAEGLPNIIYEALSMRTPLLLSKHPAFVDRLQADQDAIFFKSANVNALTEAIAKLLDDRSCLQYISDNSAAALDSLYVGIERTDLIAQFLTDPTNADNWVNQICLEKSV